MNVIVVIDGREAIPVRAIPYVSAWEIGPDELAEQFARTIGAPFARLRNTSAHHLHDGLPVKVRPKEWDGVVVRLAALESCLRSQFSDDKQGYDAWREASVQRLPAGVFVWLDEFSMDFQADLSPDRITLIREREKERDLVLTPMLDSATSAVVMAGFEPVVSGPELHAMTECQATPEPAPVVEAPARESKAQATGPNFTMKKAALIEQHKQEWPTIEGDIKDAHRNGLDAAKAGAREWDESRAMEWARAKGKLSNTDKPTQTLAGAMNSMANLTGRKHTLQG